MELGKRHGSKFREVFAQENAQYISSDFVKEGINAIANVLRVQVFRELGFDFKLVDQKEQSLISLATPPFALIGDETLDAGKQEQLAIVVRSVRNGEAVERFVGMRPLNNKTADQIAGNLVGFSDDFRLPLSRFWAVGSDGSSNWSGCKNGVWEKMKEFNSLLIAIHCLMHRGALLARDSLEDVRPIKHVVDTLESITRLYEYSGERLAKFLLTQEEMDEEKKDPLRFTKSAATRFLSREHVALRLYKLFPAVIVYLITDSYNPNAADKAKVVGLYYAVSKYEFVAGLSLLCDLLPVLGDLNRLTQVNGQDWLTIQQALPVTREAIRALKDGGGGHVTRIDAFIDDTVQAVRAYGDAQEADWLNWQQEEAPCASWGTILHTLTHFSIESTQLDKEKFKKVQKQLVQSVLDRFDQRFQIDDVLVHLSRMFNVRNLPRLPDEVKDSIKAVHERFKSVLDCDLLTLQMHYGTFLTFAAMERHKDANLTPSALLKAWLQGPFASLVTSITRLILLLLAIPVSSAEAERVFSAMKRIKTDKRVSMGETMLDDLLFISLNAPPADQFNYKLAVLSWYGQRKRRMQFSSNFVAAMTKQLGWVTMKPVAETVD